MIDIKAVEKHVERFLDEFYKEPEIITIIDRLDREIPPKYSYHSRQHTDDVLHEVVLFAMCDGLLGRPVELLAWAAAFHDAGHLVSSENHEAIGAQMLREAMERNGNFSDGEIKLAVSMVIDTENFYADGVGRQIPSTELAAYLLDADMSNFGREDFLEKAELLIQELGVPRSEFYPRTLRRVRGHVWYTRAGMKLRLDATEENIKKLQNIIREMAEG